MSRLAWLAIPLVAVLLAIAGVWWSTRPRPRKQMREAARRFERFKAAFEEPGPD